VPTDDRLWVRWDDVDALLARALERPSEERAAFISDAAADDAELRQLVSRLLDRLAADPDRATSPPDSIVSRAFGTPLPSGPDTDLASGTAIGRYLIVRRRARGGMATVYEAERADGEYRQRVALKILRRGLDTDDLVQRFLTERQILSSLSHPNIARLLDGGSTADGRPFLVMELVEGRPITAYADEHGLDTPARLALFLHVADAVDAAHRQLVVHRDIKPSNIFVEAGGQVKLLDFGIAKLLDADVEHTRAGSRAMTPDYASPEQLSDGLITTATDVYQLGLLLRELLTGLLPRASDTDSDGAPRRAGQLGPRRLTGDLAIIVAKALRTEPQERYASASELASDVRRHLAGRPIMAHPESRGYRLRKFVRRNPWGVAAGAITLTALVGYALTITVHSRRLAEERDRAGREAMKAAQVTEFVVQLFQSADPNESGGAQVTARELLDRGAEQVGRVPGGDPAVQAAMLAAIGRSYYQLGLYPQAQSVLERALEARRAGGIGQDREAAADLGLLAEVVGRSERERGLELFEEALALAERAAGPTDPLTGRMLVDYVMLRASAGARDSMHRSMLDRAVKILRAASGDHRADLAHALTVSAYGRDPEEAIPLMREGLSLRRSLFGEVHAATASSMSDLALVTERVDPLAADSLMLASLGILEKLYGRRHATTLGVMNNLAGLRRDRGDYAAAAPLYREVLALRRELYPEERRSHAYALYGLGLTLSESGEAREGEAHLREALAILRETEAPASPLRSLTRAAIGYSLARQQRFVAAESLLVRAHSEIRSSALGAGARISTLRRVIWLYREWGRPDKAAEYRALLDERLAAAARSPTD
jgi:serine/threonine-protein kinase